MKGMGAVVFLVVFFIMLLATLAVPNLPIGRQLYGLFGVPESDYPVLGISVTTLVSAVLNGVFYGVIVWLGFTLGNRYRKAR
jgi:predicted secreted protein